MHRCIHFKRAGLAPWIVTHTEVRDGLEFIKLSLADTGFCRFVSGSRTGAKSMRWLDEMKQKRLNATLQHSSESMSLFEGPPTAAAKLKQKRDAELKLKSGVLPPYLSIEVPTVEFNDMVEPARTLKIVPDVDCNACIRVECAADVISYVRVAMLASDGARKRSRRVNGQGSIARRERGGQVCFVARRIEGGKVATKTFAYNDEAAKWAAATGDEEGASASSEEGAGASASSDVGANAGDEGGD